MVTKIANLLGNGFSRIWTIVVLFKSIVYLIARCFRGDVRFLEPSFDEL